MHKIILLLTIMPFLAFSQFKESRIDSVTTKYCRIRIGTESTSNVLSNKSKLYALVDFGFEKGSKEEPLEAIVDDNNKKVYFSSYVEILNLFHKKGWELFYVRESTSWSNSEFLLQRKRGN